MPPKTVKRKTSRSRSKSTDKKPARSRSASRPRTQAKPKNFSSETKRPRSSSRERSQEASPIKISTRSVTSVVKTISSSPRLMKTPSLPSCCLIAQKAAKLPCILFGMLVMPFLIFYLNCLILTPAIGSAKTKFGQSVQLANAYIPVEISSYFDWRIHLVILATILKSCIITKYLNFGLKVTQVLAGKRFNYCSNFWLVFIAAQLPLVFAFCRGDLIQPGFKVTKFIINGIPSIFAVLFITLVVDTCFLYSLKRSGFSKKTLLQRLSDFYEGRDPRPVVLGYDVKILEKRIALCFMFSIVLTFAMAQYEELGHLEPALAFAFVTTVIRVLDAIIFEHKSLISHNIVSVGCGFNHMMEMKLQFPLMYTLFAQFYYVHPELGKGSTAGSMCNGWLMGIASVVFLVGYYICRAAENQKYAFRTDPHHPRFAGFETIPTSSGKKLLAGGWWALVRHPNYLGAQMMTASLAIPLGCSYPFMWLLPLFSLAKMIEKIGDIEEHMAGKYTGGYLKYKAIVPKRLIPGIY